MDINASAIKILLKLMTNVNQLNKLQDQKDKINLDLSQFVPLELTFKDMNKNVFYVQMDV